MTVDKLQCEDCGADLRVVDLVDDADAMLCDECAYGRWESRQDRAWQSENRTREMP